MTLKQRDINLFSYLLNVFAAVGSEGIMFSGLHSAVRPVGVRCLSVNTYFV